MWYRTDHIHSKSNEMTKNLIILFWLTMSLTVGMVYGQTTTTKIVGHPENSHGFLIWETDTTKVMFHKYEFHKVTFTPTDTTDMILSIGEVWRRGYLEVPDEYVNPADAESASYYVNLIGVDHSFNELPDEMVMGPIGGGGVPQCYWECVSSNYAYRIQQTNTNDGASSYKLWKAYEFEQDGEQTPFYRYFSLSEFFHYTGHGPQPEFPANGIGDPYFHNLTAFPAPGTYGTTQEIMVYENAPNSFFYDNTGSEIMSSPVYAIQKGFGPWYPNSPNIVNVFDDKCNGSASEQTLFTMIDFMNLGNPYINPQLACWANLGGYTGPVPNPEPNDPGNPPDDNNGPCYVVFGYDNPIVFVSQYVACEELNSLYDGDSGDPDEDDYATIFTNLLTSSEAYQLTRHERGGALSIVSGSASSFVTADGSPNIPTHTFEPGVYTATLKRPGKTQRTVTFEVTQTYNVHFEHKDYFTALMFPNPHQGDVYYAHMETTARLKPLYELFDGQGNKVYEQRFDLPKDHDANHKIDIDVPLPVGFLYHKFTFEDGSHASYTTLNQ